MTSQTDLQNRRAIAHVECELAVLDFMAHFDAGNADAAAALFAEHGRWERADGSVVEGRAALFKLVSGLNPGVIFRHVVTNVRTELLAPDHARVNAYVTLYRHQADGDKPAFPVPLDGAAGFGVYIDELRRMEEGWLIVRKTSITEFKRA